MRCSYGCDEPAAYLLPQIQGQGSEITITFKPVCRTDAPDWWEAGKENVLPWGLSIWNGQPVVLPSRDSTVPTEIPEDFRVVLDSTDSTDSLGSPGSTLNDALAHASNLFREITRIVELMRSCYSQGNLAWAETHVNMLVLLATDLKSALNLIQEQRA